MMEYCPADAPFVPAWVHHGVSVCFFDTVAAAVPAAFVLVFGTAQLHFYYKYGTPIDNEYLRRSWLYWLQLLLHLVMALVSPMQFLGSKLGYGEGEVFGFEIVYAACNALFWVIAIAVLLTERNSQLPSALGNSGHGAVLLVGWSMAFVAENLAILSLNNTQWFFHLKTLEDKIDCGLFVLRYVLTLLLFVIGIKAPGISQASDFFARLQETEEGGASRSASSGSTWSGLYTKLGVLLPYLWPKKSLSLQLRVLACLSLLISVRVANVFVPIFYKKIVDSFTIPGTETKDVPFCWQLIVFYVALKFTQGSGTGGQGFLNNLRSFLWIRVQQYTTREIQVGLFTHLHGLSLRWHLSRKTGELLRVMDRGTTSVNSLLSYLIFNILPTIVDIVVAVVYFTTSFNIWFGLITLVTMVLYLALTVVVTEWRTQFRRSMNLADNEQRTKGVDSLLNFETVKYYGAEKYEIDRYEAAIFKYQGEEWKSLATLTMLNMLQSVIMNVGLLVGCLYAGYLVSERQLTPGDYVLFGTYILQLTVPLNFLGTLYRVIQESFVNMENMLDLLEEPQEIKDEPNALPIAASKGHIEFRNVTFGYNSERIILKNVSFEALPGQTVALVGPTGSGKSTVIRLLFRFYDVHEGAVLIDGQDVRQVTQASVRKAIGVVPQDTVLFNDTIRYNVRYGRPEASDADVERAAALADIHSRIVTFPEEYETKVGERGLKLSGGEKQRVAIARTMLKAPLIILLDEATSALDTRTERNIQTALDDACRGRTTIIVAHRLSTITHADCILVLKDGEIVERGRHEELLELGAEYAGMWQQQSQGLTQENKEEQQT